MSPAIRARRDGAPAMIRRPRDRRWRWFGGDGANIGKLTGATWSGFAKSAPYPDYPFAFYKNAMLGIDPVNDKLFRCTNQSGQEWTEVFSDGGLNSYCVPALFITASGRALFQFDASGKVAYSDDGITWNVATNASDFKCYSNIAQLPGGRLVMGGQKTVAPTYAAAAYSDDNGATWTRADFPGTNTRCTQALLLNGAAVYCLTRCFNGTWNEMRVFSSSDGTTWTDQGVSDQAVLAPTDTVGVTAWIMASGRHVWTWTERGSAVQRVVYTDNNGLNCTFSRAELGPVQCLGNSLYLPDSAGNVLVSANEGGSWATHSTGLTITAFGLAIPNARWA